jgi:hypothetical protein
LSFFSSDTPNELKAERSSQQLVAFLSPIKNPARIFHGTRDKAVCVATWETIFSFTHLRPLLAAVIHRLLFIAVVSSYTALTQKLKARQSMIRQITSAKAWTLAEAEVLTQGSNFGEAPRRH